MSKGQKNKAQRVRCSPYLTFPLLVWIALASLISSEGETWAWTRDLVATPALMGSPLQVIESRMRSGQLQRFESTMLDSPLQLIGSPFGPYRFATLPNLQELRATRRSISALPAMVQIPRGVLLLLPYYVVPPPNYFRFYSVAVTEETSASLPAIRPPAKSKFFSARCGQFVEITIPPYTSLTDEENKPC